MQGKGIDRNPLKQVNEMKKTRGKWPRPAKGRKKNSKRKFYPSQKTEPQSGGTNQNLKAGVDPATWSPLEVRAFPPSKCKKENTVGSHRAE